MTPRAALRPMQPREPTEAHRSSTTLELLFDLVLVVAVSFAAQQLARSQTRGDVAGGRESYLTIFGHMLLASMWWVYFELPQDDAPTRSRTAYVWGYGHFVVFAAAAGVSAGLEVAISSGNVVVPAIAVLVGLAALLPSAL